TDRRGSRQGRGRDGAPLQIMASPLQRREEPEQYRIGHPRRLLAANDMDVAKLATVEEGALMLPEAPLDARAEVGIAANGLWTHLVMDAEGEEAGIVASRPDVRALHGFASAVPSSSSCAAKARLIAWSSTWSSAARSVSACRAGSSRYAASGEAS